MSQQQHTGEPAGPHTGQCLCGAVTFSAARLGRFGVCHCVQCRRWTGSALFSVSIAEADMVIAGEEAIRVFRSSDIASRSSCGTCGSPLWYRYDEGVDGTGDYAVTLGLLDAPDGLCLAREIFIDQKPDSFALAGEHTRMTRAELFAARGIDTEGA